MSIPALVVASILLSAVLGFVGIFGGAGLRGVMRGLLALTVLVFGALTLAFLYAGFALASKGGGVLPLFAVPTGLVTWFAAAFFLAAGDAARLEHMSPQERQRYADARFDGVRDALEQSIANKRSKLQGFWLSPARRRALRASLAAEEALLRDTALLEASYRANTPQAPAEPPP